MIPRWLEATLASTGAAPFCTPKTVLPFSTTLAVSCEGEGFVIGREVE